MASPGRYHQAHIDTQGPGDARPTARQILEDEGVIGKLTGKVAVITGTSGGIGVETVRRMHDTGATVIAIARKEALLHSVIKEIESSDPNNKAPILPVIIDQESLDSVRKGAKEILQKSGGKITYLICNAGIMATPEGKTMDGFERQFGVNHLSHFLLFALLKDALLAGSTPELNSRVIVVSSIGHRSGQVQLGDYNYEKTPYEPWPAYGQAKTANIWMANEIDRRYGTNGIHALSLHPGGIDTGLQKYVDPETAKEFDSPVSRNYMKSIPQGAATQIYAAVSKDWEGKGGKYLSNCEEQGPEGNGGTVLGGIRLGDDGYADWAYDVDGAKRLWDDSCKMVAVDV
jgi:NAD(P)-dependent dehydrogenase (short-subunit alcohol dehydrogenase family)